VHSGTRLAGWLFARVIGERPTRQTVHYHHDWKSTVCAGPYMDKLREQVFLEVEAAYNEFAGGSTPPPPAPTPAGKSIDQVAREVIAGAWGNGPDRSRRLVEAGYSYAEVQAAVNRILGANVGNAPTRPSISLLASQVIAGQWGNGAERERRITAAGYDYQAVRAEVNRRLLAADIFVPREVF
jgi:hypothetical protein